MTIRERLAAGDVLVADGAMGTFLLGEGFEVGSALEAAALERPDLLEKIAGDFAAAGSDLVQANTFGAHPANLARHGLDDRCEEITAKSVRAARLGAGDRADELAELDSPIDVAFRPVINAFRGRQNVELHLADWRRADEG